MKAEDLAGSVQKLCSSAGVYSFLFIHLHRNPLNDKEVSMQGTENASEPNRDIVHIASTSMVVLMHMAIKYFNMTPQMASGFLHGVLDEVHGSIEAQLSDDGDDGDDEPSALPILGRKGGFEDN